MHGDGEYNKNWRIENWTQNWGNSGLKYKGSDNQGYKGSNGTGVGTDKQPGKLNRALSQAKQEQNSENETKTFVTVIYLYIIHYRKTCSKQHIRRKQTIICHLKCWWDGLNTQFIA